MSLRLPQLSASFSSDKHARPTERVPVLSVSPIDGDHQALEGLLPGENWAIHRAMNVASAVRTLQHSNIPVVVCHSDSLSESWKLLLQKPAKLSMPPSLVLASRLADEYLWVEALNLGAYDVLAKPFVPVEVRRVLSSAWLRWRNEHVAPANPSGRMAIALSV